MNVRGQQAADRILKATGGRVEIRLFPNNQLGSDTDMLSQLRSGAIEFFTLSGLILSTLVPPASINGVGFAFKDYDQVWAAMDGKLGAYVRGEIDKRGLHALDKIWDNGFRQTTTSSKPIKTPDDMRGMKLRVPVSPLWTSMFTALGASPASINFSEVYSALQTHIVDGQENPLSLIDTAKLYEVQKYCSMTNHMWDGFWFLANRRAWERLPPDLQEIVAREINASAVAEREDLAKANTEVKAGLEGKGLVFNDVDTAAVPAEAEGRRVLQGMARQVRRGGLARAGGERRRDFVTAAAAARASLRPAWPERALAGMVEAAAALLVLAEIGILLLGVIARFGFNRPIVWTDELASILFLWLAMLGSVIALQRGQHMRLTAIVTSRRPPWRGRAETLALGAPLLFLAFLLPEAADYAQERVLHHHAGARLVRHGPRRRAARSASC